MSGPNTDTATTALLDLPPEIRCEIYDSYLAMHRGEMRIRPRGYATSMPESTGAEAKSSPPTRVFEEQGQGLRYAGIDARTRGFQMEYNSVTSRGPHDVLCVNRFIQHEALASLLQCLTFRFRTLQEIEEFQSRYESKLTHVRSIIIDQSATTVAEMKEVLRSATRMPNLNLLRVYLRAEIQYLRTSLPKSLETHFTRFKARVILESGVFKFDPTVEHRCGPLMWHISSVCQSHACEACKALNFDQLVEIGVQRAKFGTDGDGIRAQLRERKFGEAEYEPLEWMREGLAIESWRKRSEPRLRCRSSFAQRFYGIKSIVVLQNGIAGFEFSG